MKPNGAALFTPVIKHTFSYLVESSPLYKCLHFQKYLPMKRILSEYGDRNVSPNFAQLVCFFLRRSWLIQQIYREERTMIKRMSLSIIRILFSNCSSMDTKYVNIGKFIRKSLLFSALGYRSRLELIDRDCFSTWCHRSFLIRFLKSKRILTLNKRKALIMIADLFLYIPSEVEVPKEKFSSIEVQNYFSNDYLIDVSRIHFQSEIEPFVMDFKTIYQDVCGNGFSSEGTPHQLSPHYSLGKTGVFCSSPLSFLVDYMSVKKTNTDKSIMRFSKAFDPITSSRYFKGSFALCSSLYSIFDNYTSDKIVKRKTKNVNPECSGGLLQSLKEGLFLPYSLRRLFISLNVQSLGSVKDRFKTSRDTREPISLKVKYPRTTLCRNYPGLEKSWKFRNILIVNTWIQQSLMTLHRIVFDLLKKIPQDITFDQDTIYDFVSRHGISRLVSLDLSDATTQQHSSLMEYFLQESLNCEAAREMIKLVKEDLLIYFDDKLTYKYTSGTAQGTRAIWALFVLCHHLITRKSFNLALEDRGKMARLDHPYILLGDNLTIHDPDYNPELPVDQQQDTVTSYYIQISGAYNGSFDHSVSWHPGSRVEPHGIEIAKRYFYDTSNLTPVVLNFLMPFEFSGSHEEFVTGCIEILTNSLLPRLRFRDGEETQFIFQVIRRLLFLEKRLFSERGNLLSYLVLFKLDLYSMKPSNPWKNLSKHLIKLIHSVNSLIVSEFGFQSYYDIRFKIIIHFSDKIISSNEKMINDSIPFKYADLPKVLYLNYIMSRLVEDPKNHNCIFPEISSELENLLFSEIRDVPFPLTDICLFKERISEDLKESLEKFYITAFCLLVTGDIRYVHVVIQLAEQIRSPYIVTHADFGIKPHLSKGKTIISKYSLSLSEGSSEIGNIISNEGLAVLRTNLYQKTLLHSKILGSKIKFDDILVLGDALLMDSFSQNRP